MANRTGFKSRLIETVNHMAPRLPKPLSQEEALVVKRALSAFLDQSSGIANLIGPLGGGYLNRNYLVRKGRVKYVLRRYDYNNDVNVIEYEHKLFSALPTRLHTATLAKPIPALNGETIVTVGGHSFALFPFINGELFDHSNTTLLAEAGYTLAAYHNAIQDYAPIPRMRPNYGTVQTLDWVAKHASGTEELWKRVKALPIKNARERRISNSLELLSRESAHLKTILSETAYAAVPQLVIHNDVAPHNVLCRGNKIVALLDFDLATWDARAYDLATAIVWFSEDASTNPSYLHHKGDRAWALSINRAQLLFKAYTSRLCVPFSQAEIDLLPHFVRTFVLWLAIWYLDLRIAGSEWYPEELSGLIGCLQWLRTHAEAFVDAIVAP